MTALTFEEEQKRLQDILSQDSGLTMVYPAPKQRNNSNRVVVVPGSYNPMHNGHKDLIYRATAQLNASEVMAVLIPSSGVPMHQRLEMMRMEQARIPYMSIAVGSAELPCIVSQLPKGNQYTCAVGADVFGNVFSEGADFEALFSIDWLVADINTLPPQARKYAGRVKSLVLDSRDISSNDIRELLNAREPIVLKYVAEDQLAFISREGIYF